MKIISAEFLTGAVSAKQYPRGGFPEFAFAGRSNVGKSSLMNSLLNRKKLVKTSSTPGKTQMINFFKINDRLIFADLPGFGFAKVPAAVQRRWKRMIEDYLLGREALVAVVFLIDIRREPTEPDLHLMHWLEEHDFDYILVATKADKLPRQQVKPRLAALQESFLAGKGGRAIAYSSKNNTGRIELWKEISNRLKKTG